MRSDSKELTVVFSKGFAQDFPADITID